MSDAERFATLLEGYAGVYYGSNIISTLVTGIQLFMCIFGLSTFLETPRDLRKGRLPYILISWAIFILSVIPVGYDLSYQFTALYHSTNGQEYVDLLHNGITSNVQIATTSLTFCFIALADGLLLYRCYIIWKDRPWVLFFPVLMYPAVIAMLIYNVTLIPGLREKTTAEIEADTRSSVAAVSLTVGLNAITTSLIIFRLLRAQRSLSQVIPGRSLRIYKGAVSVLVESALPLTVCGIISCIVNSINGLGNAADPSWTLRYIGITFDRLYVCFAALSPQMIIFRVTTGRSFVRHGETTATRPARTKLGPLEFHGTDYDTFADESRIERGAIETSELGTNRDFPSTTATFREENVSKG
ncbi:hypothetical protein CC1G_10497 [Coprinopsis cinerea okayama7|uniref:Uncharacterized protein n=1 Tax=Coprinopsis cinerea (strain Okayama-7 / 130 / ATCC MYA-4618 / FGSC 9003) TaxID=240176 RepID=A8NL64_COPC7|nr:hypothetical protein CC1G_10497 [Coprinopsis cinerea okayama7\|eukprot:XP_001834623.1 hypothetical protein CC1G_10497 [Coprinopsis cinerea okayama7\